MNMLMMLARIHLRLSLNSTHLLRGDIRDKGFSIGLIERDLNQLRTNLTGLVLTVATELQFILKFFLLDGLIDVVYTS